MNQLSIAIRRRVQSGPDSQVEGVSADSFAVKTSSQRSEKHIGDNIRPQPVLKLVYWMKYTEYRVCFNRRQYLLGSASLALLKAGGLEHQKLASTKTPQTRNNLAIMTYYVIIARMFQSIYLQRNTRSFQLNFLLSYC